jgi:hypothetical protein
LASLPGLRDFQSEKSFRTINVQWIGQWGLFSPRRGFSPFFLLADYEPIERPIILGGERNDFRSAILEELYKFLFADNTSRTDRGFPQARLNEAADAADATAWVFLGMVKV